MKFDQFLNPVSPAFNVPGFPTTLYPEAVPEEIANQITGHFIGYDIAVSPPWVWLLKWHNTIARHLYQWQKLIESERALRDEDGIYNYDLTEETEFSNETGTETSGTGTDEQFMSDTPDGSLSDIANYMSSGAKNSSASSGESSGTSSGASSMRRYGNIGVMTSAQILGGYRDATNFDAYEIIFRDLEPLFIGVFDLDDNGEFDLTINSEV